MNTLDTLKENIFSVGEFLQFVDSALRPLSGVRVKGELQQVSFHPTGVYIKLRDATEEGVLSVYCPTSLGRSLDFELVEGLEVVITGTPGVYKRRSELTFRALQIELAGEGGLKKAYDALKLKLETEGLFDRKRKLPEFVTSVGVITSKTGAVISDFKNNLQALGISIYLYNVRVEGLQAERQILGALEYFKNLKVVPDVLVMIRGGGSLEDLQAFNSEAVCRAVYASTIPTLVAIGHDRDVPLVQLVSDLSASTPTAAAVAINQTWSRLSELGEYKYQLFSSFEYTLESLHATLLGHKRELLSFSGRLSEKILIRKTRLLDGYSQVLERARSFVLASRRRLDDLNPEKLLAKGYVIAKQEGNVLRKVRQVNVKKPINLQFHDGEVKVKVYGEN
ncbi:MAG TPA: exodeoxyribonuclease VII large subunit [Patescibacteria group bacterium]|nr:exodeoxyribonuclease VII large subunit [Patescibacteria group bacterium]